MRFFKLLFITLLTLLVVPSSHALAYGHSGYLGVTEKIHTKPSAENPNGYFYPTNPNFKVTPTGKNSCAMDAIWAQVTPEKKAAFERPLAKLAYAEEFTGATERRTET